MVLLGIFAVLLTTQHFIGWRAPGPAHRGPHGEVELRVRRFRYASLGALALGPGAIVSWVVLTVRPEPEEWAGVLLASAIVTACVATATWCVGAEFRACIRIGMAGLDRVGVLGHRWVEWSEVAQLVYNPAHHWFFLTLADGTHLWLGDDLDGIGSFAELALARLRPEALRADPLAREVLADLAEASPAA